ncbi:hypothetical protein ACFLYB_03640 [Chloroflexota bacterium]
MVLHYGFVAVHRSLRTSSSGISLEPVMKMLRYSNLPHRDRNTFIKTRFQFPHTPHGVGFSAYNSFVVPNAYAFGIATINADLPSPFSPLS